MIMVFNIVRYEFRSLLRDKKLIITGFIFLLLVSLSIVGGYRHYHQITRDRQESQNLVRKSWLNQREKNPHSAAHYGTFAYRPMSVLSFFDLGIDTYAGNSIYLEAHRQNEPRFSVASESSSIIRFGELTVAFILQVILPLFIFFIGFNIISKEREDNTLKIIFSQGIDMKRLAWAKLIALLGLICMLLIPIFIGILILGYKTLSEPDGFLFPSRVSILFLTYFLYVFILCAITVCISAMMKNSRNALLLLLGVWIFSCIILPKVSANIGESIHQAPSGFEFREAISKDEKNGIDGHNPADKRFDDLRDSVLRKYNAKSVKELPVNFDAIAMQEGERYSSMVYNKHFTALRKDYLIQNSVSQFAGLVDPYLAVRNFSMSLSGSDLRSAFAFQEQAELYRFNMVKYLNNYLRDFSRTGEWDKTAPSSIYSKIPDFTFIPNSTSTVLLHNILSIISLLIWTIACIIGLSSLNNKVN